MQSNTSEELRTAKHTAATSFKLLGASLCSSRDAKPTKGEPKVEADFAEDREEAHPAIYVWGDNSRGQLALFDSQSQQVQDPIATNLSAVGQIKWVACGRKHTVLVSQSGYVFALGDNSFGQLGVPACQMQAASSPVIVPGLAPISGRVISEAHCADDASFAVVRAAGVDQSDELYSWGSQACGILGRQSVLERPGRIEFCPVSSEPIKILMVSAGSGHAALLSQNREVFVWGANNSGQLGLGDAAPRDVPTKNELVSSAAVAQVSCGRDFSFLISGQNEIMISGRLPFTVQTDQGQELDFICTFQSIAQFEQRVKIEQVEASRFASIVVDPVEQGQPKELFFWGQSPLGVFNELTPLNQIFAGSYEQQSEQTFNVQAVKNGLNFCVFVDHDSGMTYQIGAEGLVDPYLDDALVSLSELRDAQFSEKTKFACGHNFVIGESLTAGVTVTSTLASARKVLLTSPAKQPASEVLETSLQLVSPEDSKQSFRQRALYQGSLSPSTPSSKQSAPFSDMKCQHNDLVLCSKQTEGCMASAAGTPKIQSCQKLSMAGDAPVVDSQRKQEFYRSGQILSSRLVCNVGTSEGAAVQLVSEQAEVLEKFRTQLKKAKQMTFSPDVSPIDAQLQETICSGVTGQIWMDGPSEVSADKLATRQKECADERARQQLPLQISNGQHVIYQCNSGNRSPDHQKASRMGLACYLPVQQQASPHASLFHGFGAQPVQMVHSLERSMNKSGFLNTSQQQHSFYELMVKEKLQGAQLVGQLKEVQRQLDKSRKDYAKLLSQVDEDQEETAQLKEKVRQQKVLLAEMEIKSKEWESQLEKTAAEKAKLETEVKQMSTAFLALQTEHSLAQLAVRDFEAKQRQCTSEKCRQTEKDLDAQLQRRSKEIYELTVQLGCIQTENNELKSQLEDKTLLFEQRLDSSRLMLEQELQEACAQIKELSEAFSQAQAQIQTMADRCTRDATVQTSAVSVEHKLAQTCKRESDLPQFVHSSCQDTAFEMPLLPQCVCEPYLEVRRGEADLSFEASVSFNQQEEQFSAGQDSLQDMSLQEFKFLEQASQFQRQSLDLSKHTNALMASQKGTSKSRLNLYQSNAVANQKPKHNFMANRSNASIEPKILRASDKTSACITAASSRRIEQNRSANFAHSHFIDEINKRQAVNADFSICNLGDRSGDHEESWQTFKPSTVCPNERYSLKRHQELFIESQLSQNEDSQSNLVEQQKPQSSQRRAKSNLEAGCLQLDAVKQRRLRHQRNAEATQKRSDSNFDEAVSQRSTGAKSNMTTPARHYAQLENANSLSQRGNAASFALGSQLKQPTLMEKSPATVATLSRIDSQSKLGIIPVSTRNPQAVEQLMPTQQQPCQTPVIRNSSGGQAFFPARAKPELLARSGDAHSHSMNSFVANRSVTPKVKSQSVLQSNAQLDRQVTAGQSAAARRAAYEQRRRTTMHSSKQISKLNQSGMPGRGSGALAHDDLSKRSQTFKKQPQEKSLDQRVGMPGQEFAESSLHEEPFTGPPQQASQPMISVCEDSELPTLMSARNPVIMRDLTDSEQIQLIKTDRSHMSHTMQTAPCSQQINLFQVSPAPNSRSSQQEGGEPGHQLEMKAKLVQIQQNKQLLERKIREYEEYLKKISKEPVSQQILKRLTQSFESENSRPEQSQSDSEYTLGDSQKNCDKNARRPTLKTQERSAKRTAFQTLNNAQNLQQSSVTGSSSQSGSLKYRECMNRPPEQAPSRGKAPASMASRTHYTNVPIFHH